jgi:biopolymer transport protein ExbD
MKRARRVSDEAELDVIPVLSLIVHLIPMLLLGVRFVTLAQVTTGPPVPTRPAADAGQYEAQEQKVVSVRVTGEGFQLGGVESVDPKIPCSLQPCAVDTYDFVALNRALVLAHAARPSDGRIIIAPDASVPYEVVVRVMDAARARRDAEGKDVPMFGSPLLATPADTLRGAP